MAILFAGASLSHPVSAEDAWVERGEIVAQLANSYAEAPAALGVTAEGAVLVLFRTEDGGSWTLVVTLPNGLSRVVATSDAWTPIAQPVKGRVS